MLLRKLFLAAALALAGPLAAADEPGKLKGHGGPVKAVLVDDTRILTASFDNSIGIWDVKTGAPTWLEGHAAAVNAAAVLPGGGIASAGDDFDLFVWGADGSLQHKLSGHTAKVMNISAFGAFVATASWDRRVGIWNAATGEHVRWLEGHKGPVNDLAFSSDGETLFTASYDGSVLAWNWRAGTVQRTLARHGFGINVIALDDARGWLAYGALDGGTRVIHIATGGQIADLSADRRPILALARRPDGAEIAIGDGEGFVMVVETEEWTIRKDFKAAHRGPVWALDYARGGDAIWAAGIDDTVYRFDLANRSETLMAEGDRSFLRAPETMGNGERQFMRKCSVCHTLTGDGARRAGPSLAGLFGRKAGSVEGYAYSSTLQRSDLIWTEDTVAELFNVGPDHYLPGTKMPMQVIVKARDRADLVAFLKLHTTGDAK